MTTSLPDAAGRAPADSARPLPELPVPPAGPRWRRWAGLAALAFALALGTGHVAWVDHATRADLQARLARRQAESLAHFNGWLDLRTAQARRWADAADAQALVHVLLAMDEPTPARLADHALHRAFRERFALTQAREGLLGYAIVSPHGVNLASFDGGRTGARNVLWHEPEFFEQMRREGGAVSPLIATDEALENNGAELEGRDVALFVGVPIRLAGDDEPAAYFIVRIAPEGLLAHQSRARFGAGGVSYLVDRHGRLHADRAWLNLDLAQHGLRGETFRNRVHLFARDPGRNLLLHPAGPAPAGTRERLPLTQAALGVQRGDGLSLTPYRDHRGVEVVGSWAWSARLALGVVSELPAAEAFAPVALARQRAMAGAIAVALAAVALLLWNLQRSRARLRAAVLRAEAASRAKGVFVANMSHEIRTPLNAVLGIAHLLGGTPLTPSQRDYVGMISRSGEALLNILNDILDYSKVEAGKLELHRAEFSLYDMVDTLASIMSVNAAPKDLELVIGIEPDVPTHLLGDGHRLLQVLVNLTGNAIKFTQRGEVVLQVRAEHRDGHPLELRFEVRDTGIGIAPERLPQLFTAFTQADAGVAREYGGSGLGLAICKRLVDLMGGRIGVHSVPGQGSTFWFVVPLAAAPARPSATAARGAHAVRDVLVVDDSAIAREFVAKSVERLGWRAHEAASGHEALERTAQPAAAGHGYDVLLIDWKMPDLDGLQTGKAIRAREGAAQPPIVIMVTAFGRDQVLASPDADVVDAVVTKPTTPSKILDAVMEAHARRSGGGVSAPRDAYAPARGVKRLAELRLLLVEDNYINQQVARGILEAEGASVTTVDHGRAALDVLARRPGDFDIVLMDVQMPVMDGLEATRRLRSELGLALPVVAMSAGVTADERQVCTDAGMDAFIAKPLEPQGVVAQLRRLAKAAAGAPAVRPATAEAARAPADSDALHVPGIDLPELRRALNSSDDAVRRLLHRLAQECDTLRSRLELALAADSPAEATSALHAFKGVAANMRAVAAAAHVERVEAALLAHGLPAVRDALPALAAELDALRDAIRRALPAA